MFYNSFTLFLDIFIVNLKTGIFGKMITKTFCSKFEGLNLCKLYYLPSIIYLEKFLFLFLCLVEDALKSLGIPLFLGEKGIKHKSILVIFLRNKYYQKYINRHTRQLINKDTKHFFTLDIQKFVVKSYFNNLFSLYNNSYYT